MKKILILGAGTGDLTVANMLRRRLDLKQWSITVIDKAQHHVYQPGLIFLPFKFYDYQKSSDITGPISNSLPSNIDFIDAEVNLIDHEKKRVETSNGTLK